MIHGILSTYEQKEGENMNNSLHRSTQNRMIAGVCGGLGESLGIDPTIIRLIWAILTIVTLGCLGIIIYFVAALIMPEY